MFDDGPYSNADINTVKAFMVDFSSTPPESCTMEQQHESSLYDCLLYQEHDKLNQEGFTEFHTETGYSGIMFYPDKEEYAKALILEKIQKHVEGLKIEHEERVGKFREIYKWFRKGAK